MTAILHSNREQWLMARRGGIGASDVAAILGRDPRRGPLHVWAEKLGHIEVEETPWMRRGRRLEAAVAEEYSEVTGRVVTAPDPFEMQIHPYLPWFFCTLDRRVEGSEAHPAPAPGPGPLELKAVAGMKAREWRADPPEHFLLQVQAQIAVTGDAWGSLAALIGGLSLSWVDLPRHDRVIAAMLPRLEAFRQQVLRREPPEADGLAATTDILKALYAEEDGETIDLPEDVVPLVSQWEHAKATRNAADAAVRTATNKLLQLMGTATFGRLSDHSFLSLKTIERAAYAVDATSYRQLRRFFPRLPRRSS